jgi:hypothetical protein
VSSNVVRGELVGYAAQHDTLVHGEPVVYTVQCDTLGSETY